MGADKQQPESFRRIFSDQLVNGIKIAERFGHFDSVHHQHAGMHPVTGKSVVRMGAHRLRAFVLMVRENQIRSAAVNVKRIAEIF